jgi:hypothetical protein
MMRSDLVSSIIEFDIFEKYFLVRSEIKIIVWFMKIVSND